MIKIKIFDGVTDKESDDSSAPAWMVTFVRFEQRVDIRKNKLTVDEKGQSPSGLSTKTPMPVISDCFSVTVNQSKSSFSGSAEVMLLPGDINYLTAIAPGDYFIVNMVSDENKILDLYERAKSSSPINRYNDGFKGLFRVQSVHESVSISGNGEKRVVYKVTGYSFAEFNNAIYFNPFLVTEAQKDPLFFLSQISEMWNTRIKDKEINSVQNVIGALYETFLGSAVEKIKVKIKDTSEQSPNRVFQIPQQVMSLMGISGRNYVVDLNNVLMGIQKYTKGTGKNEYKNLVPVSQKGKSNIYFSGPPLQGHSYAKPEYFSQVKVWEIMNQYLNGIINEMYTTYKPDLSKETDLLFPTLVVRQKPFTSNKTAKSITNTTPFLSLPRWHFENYAGVYSFNVGRDDAARINFVQVFGRNQTRDPNSSIAFQTSANNFSQDREDIFRSGLKPYVVTSPFDFDDAASKTLTKTPIWAQTISDWLIGGHLRLSGSISCKGIEKPISVGDNLQLGDNVFHIENISHSASVSGNGEKRFTTSIAVSMGVEDDSSSEYIPYSEMEHSFADEKRLDHYNKYGDIYPTISDSQDLPSATDRTEGELNKETRKSNPFSRKDRK
jgi:hypothetical protein